MRRRKSDHDAGNDQKRCPDQPVKDEERKKRFNTEVVYRKAEYERAVHFHVAGNRLEVNPPPDQRKT